MIIQYGKINTGTSGYTVTITLNVTMKTTEYHCIVALQDYNWTRNGTCYTRYNTYEIISKSQIKAGSYDNTVMRWFVIGK